jgi:hypothetical protein
MEMQLVLVHTYLNPGEMPEARKGERDGGVHVRAGDVAGGVDHDGDDEPAGHRLPQLRDALEVLAVDGRRAACHEHQQERRHHLRDHLPRVCTHARAHRSVASHGRSVALLSSACRLEAGRAGGWTLEQLVRSYLLEEVGREDVGEGLLRVVHGGDGGAALHGGEVVDLVRVVHPRVGPRRGGGGGHGRSIA